MTKTEKMEGAPGGGWGGGEGTPEVFLVLSRRISKEILSLMALTSLTTPLLGIFWGERVE